MNHSRNLLQGAGQNAHLTNVRQGLWTSWWKSSAEPPTARKKNPTLCSIPFKKNYAWLERNLSGPSYKWVWKAPIPLKIKIFLWQLFQNAMLTRDNMRIRKWPGNPMCSFCTNIETANHLFFTCPLARTVWGVLGMTGGASCCPRSLWQSFAWFYRFFPAGNQFYMMIIAAVCWGYGTFKIKSLLINILLALHWRLFSLHVLLCYIGQVCLKKMTRWSSRLVWRDWLMRLLLWRIDPFPVADSSSATWWDPDWLAGSAAWVSF